MMNNLFDRIKLLVRSDRELYSRLYNILGFYPKHIEYYKIALTHKSQVFRNKQGRALNNERLEFLGDAVLEAIVSDIVYRQFERKDEGFLTTTRSKIVQRDTLNHIAADMKLDRLVRQEVTATAHNNYMYGNAFEALIGAIYLDRGFSGCKRFFESRVLGKHINLSNMARREVNFKSRLIEWCQKNKVAVDFPLRSEVGEGTNAPVFYSEVILERIPAGKGEGYSKKESQQNASKEALNRIRNDQKFARRVLAARDLHQKQADEEANKDTPQASGSPSERQSASSRRRRRRKPGNTEKKGEQPAIPTAVAKMEEKNATTRKRHTTPTKEGSATVDREAIISAAEDAAFHEQANGRQ